MISQSRVEALLGRAPSPAELDEIHRVQIALQARDDDAILLVVTALQSHQHLLKGFPQELTRSIAAIALDAQATARLQLEASTAQLQSDFSKTAATAAQKIAGDVSRTTLLKWIALGAIAIASSILVTAWQTHHFGYEQGYEIGLREARDERAAAAWSNTENGRAAYRLDKAGVLPHLLSCNFPGWRRQDDFCYPGQTSDGTKYGYRLP